MGRLEQVLRIKNDRLSTIVLAGHPSGAKQRAVRPQMAREDIIGKNLREIGISWEDVKRDALDGGEMCVAVLASCDLVLQRAVVSSISTFRSR